MDLKSAFGGLSGLLGKLRPAQGAFGAGNPNGTVADPTGGGWDANVQTAFAHPNDPTRKALAAAMFGVAPMMGGTAFNQGYTDPRARFGTQQTAADRMGWGVKQSDNNTIFPWMPKSMWRPGMTFAGQPPKGSKVIR